MLDFIKTYGSLVVGFLCLFFTLLCIVLKRRPKTLDEFISIINEVLKDVPYMVAIEELKVGSGNGSHKKSLVITEALERISALMGRDLTKEEEDTCICSISSMIESTLCAPQKKGESI